MTRVWTTLVSRLRPTASDLRALGRRETDPARAGAFAPIARGPVFATLALAILGVAWLFWLPWRAIRTRR